MRKNGFTLIELLAVIVILAIIALIATPIILGIINDAREKANERSIELYASAIKNGIAAYQLREGKEVSANTYGTNNPLPFDVEYDGDVKCSTIELYEDGGVYVTGCKVNGSEVDYEYGTKQGTEKACTLEDKDGNGVASLNDMITCATESFHVMDNDGTTISMLAEFNLDVGMIWSENDGMMEEISSPTGIQSELAKAKVSDSLDYYGVVNFSTDAYWSSTTSNYPEYVYNENSTLYQYVNAYETYLKENGVSSTSAALISYEQVIDLYNNKGNPSWLYTTTYWTGTANDTTNIWYVSIVDGINANLGHLSDGIANMGLRPVITISTSEIK